MKFTPLAFLPLALSVSIPKHDGRQPQSIRPRGILQPRQADILSSMLRMGNVSTVFPLQRKTVEIKPIIRSTAKRVKLSYGPYIIPAFGTSRPNGMLGMDPSSYTWYEVFDGLPKNASYLSAQIDLTYEDGSRADIGSGLYMHHVVSGNMDKMSSPMAMCYPGFKFPKMTGSEFIGAGDDSGPWLFTTGDGTFNSGYYIAPTDRMMWTGEVINYKKEPKTIYVTLEAEYVDGRPKGMLDTQISLWNVQGCFSGLGINKPPNATDFIVTSTKMPIPEDGYVVQIKGHLHDGGINLEAYINDKLACDSRATYGGRDSTMYGENGETWETIAYMSTCEHLVPVKKGDMVQLKAFYDYGKHKSRKNSHGMEQEEMGILTMYFSPANP